MGNSSRVEFPVLSTLTLRQILCKLASSLWSDSSSQTTSILPFFLPGSTGLALQGELWDQIPSHWELNLSGRPPEALDLHFEKSPTD